MIFNIPFKKKLNTWYKRFAWLPKRMTDDPNKVVWLGFYWQAWILVRVVQYSWEYRYPVTSTDSGPKTYTKEDFHRIYTTGNTYISDY